MGQVTKVWQSCTWFCYQMIAKPGYKTAAPSWPDLFECSCQTHWMGHEQHLNLKWIWMVNSLWPSDVIWWQGSRSTLAWVMACCLMVPSHYLNQFWLMINEVLWHSPDSHFTENTWRSTRQHLSWNPKAKSFIPCNNTHAVSQRNKQQGN